jgi:hypothetical protein
MTIFHVIKYPINGIEDFHVYESLPQKVKMRWLNDTRHQDSNYPSLARPHAVKILKQILMEYEDE